jgi:ABC-2 type transport system permease protein
MSEPADRPGHGLRAALRRVRALIRKETWQLLRDPSSIAIGIIMPVALLILFGYGINLDVKNVPVAIVMEENSAEARGLASAFELSSYFSPKPVKTMAEAEKMLLSSEVRVILRIPLDLARKMA